jgi:hypothetical protein
LCKENSFGETVSLDEELRASFNVANLPQGGKGNVVARCIFGEGGKFTKTGLVGCGTVE